LIISPDPTPEERQDVASIRRTQRIVFVYGAAVAGLVLGIAIAVFWGTHHPLSAYHCHPFSPITAALLGFIISGPLFIGRGSLKNFYTQMLLSAAITASLVFFSVNWWVVETCSPL